MKKLKHHLQHQLIEDVKRVIILKIYFHNLILNKLDQNFQPTDGYSLNLNKYLIYSDDLSSNTINYSNYYSITDNLILSGSFISKLSIQLMMMQRVSKNLYLVAK